jgi:hypothetical protein
MCRTSVRAVSFAILSFVLLLTTHAFAQHAAPNSWVTAGPMTVARSGSAAVDLQDGHILVTGGRGADGVILASAEVLNPDGTFTPVAAMNVERAGHTAVYLQSGGVLVIGGETASGITNTAELYDPAGNTWTMLPWGLNDARAWHSAVTLQDGNLLILGGSNDGGPVASVELFDIWTYDFFVDGALTTPRKNAQAIALADGRVLIAGGSDGGGATLNSTEIYDIATATATAGPALGTPRANATATLLLDGRVLVAGGSYPEGAANAPAGTVSAELNSAEILDLSAGTSTPVPVPMTSPRSGHLALRLRDNNTVLLVSGSSAGQELASAELFVPWTGQFAATSAMATPHVGGTGISLSGLALVAGGSSQPGAEVFSFATLKTDKPDYQPGETVVMTGSGWQPGETVSIVLRQVPVVEPTLTYQVTADSLGNIYLADYAPQPDDLFVSYTVTATGAHSQAQTSFTDGTVTQLKFSTGPVTLVTGQCSSAYKISSYDATNTLANVTSATTVTLTTTSATGKFYSNATCATVVATATIANNANTSGSFYYKDTTATSATLTGASGALNSATAAQTVNLGNTTATITSSVNPTVNGQSTTFTLKAIATAPATGAPAGTITLTDVTTSTTLGTVTLAAGSGTLAVSNLAVGAHTLSAAYSGDANYNTSVSVNFTQTVNQGSTTSTITSSNNPAVMGQTVTFTLKATATAPAVGTPTGTITLTDTTTSTVLGTATLTSGSGSVAVSNLTLGAHVLSAVYSGTPTSRPAHPPT